MRLLAAAWLAACLAVPAGAADSGAAPKAVIDQVTSEVLAVLRDTAASSAEKRRKIEEIVYTHVNFDTVSRLVLARNWKRFSKAQQAQFIDEFKQHLSMTYGQNVDNYKNERVDIIGDREETRGDWTVKTKILRGGPGDVLVDYRLRKDAGQWKVIDIIIEGVSLVSNFRSQFQDIVSNGGPERLLNLLREKNAKGESLKS